MARQLTTISTVDALTVFAVADDGTFWLGRLCVEGSPYIDWHALNPPPDGATTSTCQADPSQLSSGISGALITTMFGLIVAIPMTAGFVFLRNKVVKHSIEVSRILGELLPEEETGNDSNDQE